MPPSDDIHRFIWEGKILGHGFNPFLLAPDHASLAFLRDANWALINHPDLPTLYPPLAQLLFFLLARLGESVWVFKIGFLAFDLLGFFAMRACLPSGHWPEDETAPEKHAQAKRALALYFLNPLLIFEVAGHGHFESLPLFLNLVFLATLMHRNGACKGWAPVFLGLGILAKISSLALAPLLIFSLGWKRALAWGAGAGIVIGASLWGVGAFSVIGKFASEFRFNAAAPSLIDWALPFLSMGPRRNLSMALFGLSVALCFRLGRKSPPERQALWFMGALLLFSPTLHPWYLLWLLPFAALCGSRPWLLLTGTVLFSYEVYGRMHVTGHWRENPWIRLPEFLPPLLLFCYLGWKTRTDRNKAERAA